MYKMFVFAKKIYIGQDKPREAIKGQGFSS